MNNLTLIAHLLNKQHQTQLALAAAIEELAHWVEQRGSVEVADNVRNAIFVMDKNLVPFRRGIAALIVAGANESAAAKIKQP
ncbi:hypothetical protein KBJ94_29550 [Pseudomonas sp. ITA]|uniref:hypothetical protein n=1 Tax=Pseudomonas sp. ITA TaxID=2825841 RepID=UPI0024986ED6|nr:hypothetical protein [Pseudomonas sp. ITA]MDI2146197.1 hypothetical protein [Pseudomonas sp. ITA]